MIAAPISAAPCPSCAHGSRRISQTRAASARTRAVAAVVRLLDLGHIRVGNEGYVEGEQELRRDHAAQAPRQGARRRR